MTDSPGKGRGITGLFVGVGVALITLGVTGTRATGQRALFVIAGAMFLIAAGMRLSKSRQGAGSSSRAQTTD
jgi:hypothetical protein